MRVKGVKANSVIAISIFISITAFALAFHSSLFPVVPASAEPSYATSSEVGINVKESIKIAVDKDHLALVDGEGSTQIAPSASGTLVTGDVNVAVTTNAYGGYRLGVYTSDATTDMKHNNASVNAVVSSIAGASGYDATTGMSSLSPNTWGFRKYTEASNVGGNEIPASWSNWYGVGNNSTNMAIIDIKDIGEGPSTYCNDLSQPVAESGCSSSSYDTYKVGFGANLTSSLPAGTYTNNIIFSALTNEASTFLTFNANAPSGATVSGSMAPKSILKGSTVTLPNTTTFKRDGFGIKGWALTEGATTVASITQPDPSNPGSTITVQLTPGATVDVDSLISAIGIPSSTTGPIPLYAVWDNAYTINYIANNPEGTTVTGTMDPSNAILGLNTTIETNNYEIDNYTLKGWAFTADATDPASISAPDAKDLVSGATFTTQQLITAAASAGQSVSTSTAGTITLYAVWDKNTAYFQTMNSCATIPEGETGTLVDSRDNQEYTVYHIPKNATYPGTSTIANVAGMCIMTKDLNLGAVDSVSGSASTIVANGTMTLSPEDSSFTTPTGTNSEGITVPATNVIVSNGTGSWDTSNNNYANKQYTTSGTDSYANRGYYSWGAAMTVCPKGWRLPIQEEYNNNESNWNASTIGISKMANNNINTIQQSPWSFNFSGYYHSSFNTAGAYGYYWSSTQSSLTNSYRLGLSLTGGLKQISDSKYFGFAVRCISEATDGIMQSFDTSSLTLGETAKLMDERDNHIYKVKKLSDGKVWMINNLTLSADDMVTEGKALTSDNTNIDNNTTYYLPKAGYQGSITSSSTPTSASTVNFTSSSDNQGRIAFKAKNTTDISGNPVQEDTAYYNFYTATLGYSYYNTGSSGSSARDICPKGWRLPKVSDSGNSIVPANSEFANLARAYNPNATWGGNGATDWYYYTSDSTILQNIAKGASGSLDPESETNGAAGFTRTGGYNGTEITGGSSGVYWSSSISSNTSDSYILEFNTNAAIVYPQSRNAKYFGYAVRCVSN